MVTRLLIAGVLATLAVQAPLLLAPQTVIPWFYVMPLAAVVVFLSAMAWAAFRLTLPPTMSVAAVGAAAGYVVLVSPSRILGSSTEFTACILGASCLLVLGYRMSREVRLLGVARGWLLFGAAIAGAFVLGQSGARRYGTYVTSAAEPIGESVAWAWYMSMVLAFGAILALAGRRSVRVLGEAPGRTTRS